MEEEAERLSRKPGRITAFLQRNMFPKLVLLAVFAVAFLIRASAYRLPVFMPEDQAYLRDEAGDPYLTEMDSYFYLRKAKEMADGGEFVLSVDRNADPMIGQRVYDRPEGVSVPLGLSALAYLIWRYLLGSLGVSLTQTAVWMGTVLGSLAVIPAFCYVRKRSSLPGGIVAGLLVGCAIPFVLHTHAGFFDTDMVLALLPLTALLSQMRCMQESGTWKQIGWAFLSAASMALLSVFWRAYTGYYLLALAGSGVSLLLSFFLPLFLQGQDIRAGQKQMLRGSGFFLLFSLVLLFAFGGMNALKGIPGIWDDFRFRIGSTDSMPYTLAQTQEMQRIPFFAGGRLLGWLKAETGSVLGRMGGILAFAPALLCIPASFFLWHGVKRTMRTEHICEVGVLLVTEAGFLGLWAAAGIVLSCLGSRYAEIPVIPVCLLCGLLAGRVYEWIGQRGLSRQRILRIGCIGAAFCIVLPMCYGAWKAAQRTWPFVTDSKQAAFSWIRENTTGDTAIASWWDDGYYLEYEAERRTLADGGTDSGSMNWFLAKALLTRNPKLMSGIFRMLNESGTDALDRLAEQGLGQAEAAELLLRILPMTEEEARGVLQAEGLPSGLLKKTHPAEPNPLVLSLSTDMLAKCGTLSYFAFWDPTTREQEESAFAVGSSASSAMKDGRLSLLMSKAEYSVSLRQDLQGRIAGTYTEQGTVYEPGRLCVWEDGVCLQDEQGEYGSLALVVVRENGRYCAVLCTGNVCDSMLIRMLVCEDRSIQEAERLGTWYGKQETEPCGPQNRINYNNWPSWASQVWRIRE